MRPSVAWFGAAAAFGVIGCDGMTLDRASLQLEGPTGSSTENANVVVLPVDAGAGTGNCARASASQEAELWRRQLGPADVLETADVAVDATGDTYVTRASGGITKVSDDGEVQWTRPFGSLVATGSNGIVTVAGSFSDALALGSARLTAVGGTDVFVATLSPAGDVLRAFSVGGAGDERAASLAVDSEGNAVLSGPGLGTVKVDGAGRTLWAHPFSGALAVDSLQNVAVAGAFEGSLGVGSETLVSAGGLDVFVAKLDGDGGVLFARRFGDAGAVQRGEAVAVDAEGSLVITGVLDGAVDFGGGPLTVRPGTCPGEVWCKQSGFVLKLDAQGGFLWSHATTPARSVSAVAVDSRGHVFSSGAAPGNAAPYRTLLLSEFDEDGNELPIRLGSALTGAGAGHALAVDVCDRIVWAIAAPWPAGESVQSAVMKLAL